MRTWTRAKQSGFCGGCSAVYATGDPLCQLVVGSIVKVRCVECAGPAPPDLPLAIVTRVDPIRRPFVSVRFLADSLPLDWKQRAAGDSREPGEEG